MGEFEEKLNSILGDQQAMGQIMALAQSLGKQSSSDQEEKDTAPEPAEDAPPDLSQLMGNLDPKMREYQQDDGQNTALLQALRPYLREERRGRLDKAVQIAKMSRLLRVALGSLGGKGEDTLV